jgi:hypothetical protein
MTLAGGAADALVEIARVILQQVGFATELVPAHGERPLILVAENEYFIVVLAQAPSFDSLQFVDAELSEFIDSRLDAQLGPKRWDLYLVVLCEAPAPEDATASQVLSELRYDTHTVRRLARVGVEPTIDRLSESLRTFLPLGRGSSNASLEDPLQHLERLLSSRGIDESVAGRAVAAFRQTGDVIDG